MFINFLSSSSFKELRRILISRSFLVVIVIFLQLATIVYLHSGPGHLGYIYSDRTANGFQGDILPDKQYNCEIRENLNDETLNSSVNDWAGGIYTTFPPNYTEEHNTKKGDNWIVNTNSHGLRDEEISPKKPNETFRVLVIGDSYTFGWGLNYKERYTEVLEERFNKSYDDVQVVNMGRTNAGMKDYYLVLKDKGIKYEPDMVIVSFYRYDRNSHQDSITILKEIMDKNDIESRKELFDRKALREEYLKRKSQFSQDHSWKNTDLETYGNGILDLSQEHGFNTTFFLFQHQQDTGGERFARSVKKWGEQCGADVLLPPREFYYKPFVEHTLPQDDHFNQEYNKYMADRLYSHITKNGYMESDIKY